jgi:hypothetical protein
MMLDWIPLGAARTAVVAGNPFTLRGYERISFGEAKGAR